LFVKKKRVGKKTWEKTGLVGGPVFLWPRNEQCMIMIQIAVQVRSQIESEHSEYLFSSV